jgi:hypothetical protein
MLHSAWALTAGTVIVFLARERYHLVLWVVLFLVLAWISTLYFGRTVFADGAAPGLVHELTSYVTRALYQETLFFLLPFYTYSTVVDSPNVFFVVLLGGLAVVACIDLLFDRWLRTRPVFALTFFAIVAFAALNLLLPLIGGIQPRFAAPAAALLAIGAAAPLALRTAPRTLGSRMRLIAAAVVMLVVVVGLPSLIPPVPLRLQRATFASGFEPGSHVLADNLPDPAPLEQLSGALVVLAEVFAPSALPANVRLEWWRDGELLRVSREVEITAHAEGFRIWDAWRPTSGSVPPGHYRVILRTSGRRVFGVATITVGDLLSGDDRSPQQPRN